MFKFLPETSWNDRTLPKMGRVGHLPPIVGSWYSKNSSLTNLTTRHDLPTAVSPRRTSLKWQTRLLIVAVVVTMFSRKCL